MVVTVDSWSDGKSQVENFKIIQFPENTKPKPFSEWPELMTHKDIMSCTGLSHEQAWDTLKSPKIHRPFPGKKRGMVVGKYALRDFLNGRPVTEDN